MGKTPFPWQRKKEWSCNIDWYLISRKYNFSIISLILMSSKARRCKWLGGIWRNCDTASPCEVNMLSSYTICCKTHSPSDFSVAKPWSLEKVFQRIIKTRNILKHYLCFFSISFSSMQHQYLTSIRSSVITLPVKKGCLHLSHWKKKICNAFLM